jgi:hypothetical protein
MAIWVSACAVAALMPWTAANAQSVHKCRIDDRVVFQASPCPPEQQRAVPAAAAAAVPVAASEPASAASVPKKKTLADVLRERDGADRPQSRGRESQSDGANVLRSRMGAI